MQQRSFAAGEVNIHNCIASTLHESILYANQHNWQFKYDYQEKSHTKKRRKRMRIY